MGTLSEDEACWRLAGFRYYPLRLYFRRTFGGDVWKVSVDAGFHCPNADGTISRFGCTFCNIASFSPSRRQEARAVVDQVRQAIVAIQNQRSRTRGIEKFVAYFQPGTNTYAPVETLRDLFWPVLEIPGIVGLAIGTRPDCLSDEVLELLAELNEKTWLCVEIGLQSASNETLRRINRGHSWEDFVAAARECARRNLRVCVHLMFGLPGESSDDMLRTVDAVAHLPIHAVKLHNLYVAKDTVLANLYRIGRYRPLDQDEYVDLVVQALERLPPTVVIDRLTAETTDDYLVAPEWCKNKGETLRRIQQLLEQRETFQGRLWNGKAVSKGPGDCEESTLTRVK